MLHLVYVFVTRKVILLPLMLSIVMGEVEQRWDKTLHFGMKVAWECGYRCIIVLLQ